MNERVRYGDADAKRIIARAAEIDAEQGRQLDASALREIAAEAGISALAVERALEEHQSPTVAPVSWLKRHRSMVTTAAIVAVLFVVMLVMRSVPPPP